MELYKHTSVIVIISFAFALGSDDDVQTPRQMVAVGQQIRLECHVNVSGVDWWFRKESNYIQKNPDKTLLVLSGRLTDAYVRRGRIDFGNALILKNLTESDSGVYWCSSDSGLGYNLASIKVMGYLSVEANTKLILPCFSTTNDVDWLFQPVRDVSPNSIYTNGILYAEYSKQGRFNVGRRSPGEFSLEINNITVKESGLYTCHEDSGASPEKHTVRVVVAFYFPLNSDVSLPCQTALDQDVDWRYWKTLTSPFMQHIYSSGIIYDVYQSRHNVSKDVTTGHYNLTIKSLQPDDEGIYACIEGLGLKDKHFMELKIRDTTEISYTNKTLTDVPTVTTASVPTAITTHETPVVPVVRGAGYRLESIGLIFLLVFVDVIAVLAVCFAILYLMFKKRSRHPEDEPGDHVVPVEGKLTLESVLQLIASGSKSSVDRISNPKGGDVYVVTTKTGDWRFDGFRWKQWGTSRIPRAKPLLTKQHYNVFSGDSYCQVFRKFVYKPYGQTSDYAVVHYVGEHNSVKQFPHGNSKKKFNFLPTPTSLKPALADSSKKLVDIVAETCNEPAQFQPRNKSQKGYFAAKDNPSWTADSKDPIGCAKRSRIAHSAVGLETGPGHDNQARSS